MPTNVATRRAVLGAITLAPIAGLITAVPAPAAIVDRSAWDRALADFKRVEREHAAAWKLWDEALNAAEAMTPGRPSHLIETYNLDMSMNREAIELRLQIHAVVTKQALDVPALADEFEAFQEAARQANECCQTGRRYEEAQAHNPGYQTARDALMAIPAPDVAGLLVKIDIATVSLDDEHAESMLVDARRLLGGEA